MEGWGVLMVWKRTWRRKEWRRKNGREYRRNGGGGLQLKKSDLTPFFPLFYNFELFIKIPLPPPLFIYLLFLTIALHVDCVMTNNNPILQDQEDVVGRYQHIVYDVAGMNFGNSTSHFHLRPMQTYGLLCMNLAGFIAF